MTIRSFALIFAVAIFLALSSSSTSAQGSENVGVNVPFAFTTNGKTLPAGHYRIESTGSTRSIWGIRDPDGRVRDFVLALSRSGTAGGKVMVTFHRYGGRNFLSGFKTMGYQITLPTSKDEKDLRSSGEQLSQMEVVEVETGGPSSGK